MGSFIQTLTMVDVASGWTECLPLANRTGASSSRRSSAHRARSLAVARCRLRQRQCVHEEVVVPWFREQKLEVTRLRAYKKNDQAFVEQKNGAVVPIASSAKAKGSICSRVLLNSGNPLMGSGFRLARVGNGLPRYLRPPWKARERRGTRSSRRRHLPIPIAVGSVSAASRFCVALVGSQDEFSFLAESPVYAKIDPCRPRRIARSLRSPTSTSSCRNASGYTN
jgi:hypothetical protein